MTKKSQSQRKDRDKFYRVIISATINGELVSGAFFVWAASPDEAEELIHVCGRQFWCVEAKLVEAGIPKVDFRDLNAPTRTPGP